MLNNLADKAAFNQVRLSQTIFYRNGLPQNIRLQRGVQLVKPWIAVGVTVFIILLMVLTITIGSSAPNT